MIQNPFGIDNFVNLVKLSKQFFQNLRVKKSGYKMRFDFSVPEHLLKDCLLNTPLVGDFLQMTKLDKKIKVLNSNDSDTEHLRGLVNIANTCYMNSTIQCFAHISELYEYFQKDKTHNLMNEPSNKDKFFVLFGELIISLWNLNDNKPLYPYIFKEKLGNMNPLFQGPIPNDAKDLLTFILLQLHEELNNPNNVNNNQMNNILNYNMQANKQTMFNSFVNNFKNNYRSIISDLFYGLNYTETKCLFCNSSLFNYQTFNFLIFPLAQVLNNKIQSGNSVNNNEVTLYDCFQYNQIYSPLNDYYCVMCKNTSQGMYATYLSVLPNIIIIILNRGEGLQYNVKIKFDENLNLKNYVEYFKEDSFYELIGVVTHYGQSGASGHFMARCKSPINGLGYLYNDALIKKLEYFTYENFSESNPYILFYKKTKFV